MLGTYPTPVQRLAKLCLPGCDLWVKRDDLTGGPYGGNKVRKLERILVAAKKRKAKRIVTFGAAGSHHVLATVVYGRQAGIPVAAVLAPEPRSEHAVENLSRGLALGLEVLPARSFAAVPFVLAKHRRRGDFVVPPGGSNVEGALGYWDAFAELSAQIERRLLPSPDVIVVALGSSGTAAGILAGLVSDHSTSRLVAVRIVNAVLAGKQRTAELAWRTARRAGARVDVRELLRHLEVDRDHLGAGYGHPTPEGESATREAAESGLVLDPTYTAKTFAAALERVRSGRYENVLYWHTLSSAPVDDFLRAEHLARSPLPPSLDRLFK